MELKFISPSELSGNAKATVHKTGKLGFSAGAAEKLDLSDYRDKFAKIAINGDYTEDKNLYVIVTDDEDDESYPILKAGQYFYLSLKRLFEKFDENYKNETIIYDIKKGDFHDDGYVFVRRK